ncbi:uncharacterized protein LOC110687921 [Chenopodium quinoa]|uniref:uncharacterized protein LOC110687921 n=1 Tax=Chenopodium quinoa TaxID=63459 RepID=UPI000B76FFE9|nr:uncharacterized protein LOC110687921 [Chenopodium quinoa]
MSGHDSKYFSTTKKGEIPELKEELNSQYKGKKTVKGNELERSFWIDLQLLYLRYFFVIIDLVETRVSDSMFNVLRTLLKRTKSLKLLNKCTPRKRWYPMTSHFGPGAGKSMDIMRSTTESSGPRHVRSRGISASARRERVHYFEDDEDDDGDEEEEEEEEVDTDEVIDDQSGPYDDYGPSSRRLDDMYETRRVDVRKGRDGRFVSRFGTSSASTVFVVSRKRSNFICI